MGDVGLAVIDGENVVTALKIQGGAKPGYLVEVPRYTTIKVLLDEELDEDDIAYVAADPECEPGDGEAKLVAYNRDGEKLDGEITLDDGGIEVRELVGTATLVCNIEAASVQYQIDDELREKFGAAIVVDDAVVDEDGSELEGEYAFAIVPEDKLATAVTIGEVEPEEPTGD